MQFSIVNFSVVTAQADIRFDADYYKPNYLEEEKQVKSHRVVFIGDVAFITDGQHGYHEVDEKSPILHLTAKNAKNWLADSEGADRIAKWVDDKNKRSSLVENDLILSTRGTVGYCAIVKSNVLPANIDQDVARIAIEKNSLLPEYLLSFLNCQYGQDWIQRNSTGMVQQGLSLQKVRQTPVPLLSIEFQESIKGVIDNFLHCQALSKCLFKSAEECLLLELGLTDWQPKHRLSFVKNYSETEQAERLDAEHFQPKYDELIEAITTNSFYSKSISEIQKYNARGLQPQYAVDGELDVITSKHILEQDLNYDEFEKTSESNWKKQKKARIQKGDILTYTTGANIGRTACYSTTKPALASNHVNILRIRNENPEYVAFVMNSLIGRLQTERLSAGSAQAELYPKDIEKFLIPFAEENIQQKIVSLISESRSLKAQSKHLLECAKRAVELAIEQDEQTAMDWLEKETGAVFTGLDSSQ